MSNIFSSAEEAQQRMLAGRNLVIPNLSLAVPLSSQRKNTETGATAGTPTASSSSASTPVSQTSQTPEKRTRSASPSQDEAPKKKRRQVKRACLNCRIAHSACEDSRPCRRCKVHGLEASCIDVERRNSKKLKQMQGADSAALGLGTLAQTINLSQIIAQQLGKQQQSMDGLTPLSAAVASSTNHLQSQNNAATALLSSAIPHHVFLSHEMSPANGHLSAGSIPLRPFTPSTFQSEQNLASSSREDSFLTRKIHEQEKQLQELKQIVTNLHHRNPSQSSTPLPNLGISTTDTNMNMRHPNLASVSFLNPQATEMLQKLSMPSSSVETPGVSGLPSDMLEGTFLHEFLDHNSGMLESMGNNVFSEFLHSEDHHQHHAVQPISASFTPISSCGCVTFPSIVPSRSTSANPLPNSLMDDMCIAVWLKEGYLYSANVHFLQAFGIEKQKTIAYFAPNASASTRDPNEFIEPPASMTAFVHYKDIFHPTKLKESSSIMERIFSGDLTRFNGEIDCCVFSPETAKNKNTAVVLKTHFSMYLVRAADGDMKYAVSHISIKTN